MTYDIIGDIHGQADKLLSLLNKLEYTEQEGVYQHESRTAVFVGDFIDRGLQQKAVLNIVRPMVNAGKALAVMGNHEFNAICYHSLKAADSDQFLREHSANNTKQHQAFLDEYPLGTSETEDVIDWFKSLPLFLEIDDEFRVVHACWDDKVISNLRNKCYINEANILSNQFYLQASEKGHELYEAMEVLLKGKELALPAGLSFTDTDGNKRHEVRIKWWAENIQTYQQAAVHEIESLQNQPSINLPVNFKSTGYETAQIPVFFGHYWFTGDTFPISNNVACLDYSAAGDGPLVAYAWEQLHDLQGKNFIRSDKDLFDELDCPEFSDADVIKAYKESSNLEVFNKSDLCGCFYCLATFNKEEVIELEQGIWCPRCGIDAVLGSNAGYPINFKFLSAMNQYYF